jgi:hypothetical protein
VVRNGVEGSGRRPAPGTPGGGAARRHGPDREDADVQVCSKHNRADDGTLVAPSDYVEVVAVIR